MVLVQGDGAQSTILKDEAHEVINLNTSGDHPDIRFQFDIFRTKFLREVPERLEDLLRIAAVIYTADTKIKRGAKTDVFAEKWSREIHIVLPVRDLEFWNTHSIQIQLKSIFRFLSGDTFTFEFVKRTNLDKVQQALKFKELLDPLPKVDIVVLFSGGVDSLAATIECIRENLHPILVSHRSAPNIDWRQKNLVNLLRTKFPDWAFPNISMWVNRAGGKRPAEFSQRCRSFLFTALGVTTASLLNVDTIRLCDNGIVSINLPQSGQSYGTSLSRSTHPKFLELVQSFMRLVTENNCLSISNTLILYTKKEAMELIANSGHPDLLQETISCAHTEGKTKVQPHCGVCSQCIDRRFSSIAAGLTEFDLVERYEKNIFVDNLKDGEERTLAENYVRLALELEKLHTPDQLFSKFPQLYDCLPTNGDVDHFGSMIWKLFENHQTSVNKVVEIMITQYSESIRKGDLPNTCLLKIIGGGQHITDPCTSYINQLRSLFCESLPGAFQTNQAINERHVQDIGETILNSARERLDREAPQVAFGVIATRPDFSSEITEHQNLFIEFKYPKDRIRLNQIVTEMTSRVLIYREQRAYVLFIIYDPNRIIKNDRKFIEGFEKYEKIYVGISR